MLCTVCTRVRLFQLKVSPSHIIKSLENIKKLLPNAGLVFLLWSGVGRGDRKLETKEQFSRDCLR